MVRLKVKDLAGNMKLSELQYKLTIELKDQVYPATVRRYWYGTANGQPDGPPIKMVDLFFLEGIAKVLGVPICDLFEETQEV